MLNLDIWRAQFQDWLELRFTSKDTRNNCLSGIAPFFEYVVFLRLNSWTEADRDVLEEYRARIFAMKHTHTGQPIKVGTRVSKLVALKSFFKFLTSQGFLMANPAAMLEFPKQEKPLPAVLSEPEMLRLLEIPDLTSFFGVRDRTLLELLYGTALRNGELCSLTLDQVDLAQHLIRLQKGKGNKGRLVPLGQEAQVWLEHYLENVRPFVLRNPACHFLFVDRWGHKGLSRGVLSQIVRGLGQKAEIGKTVTPHILRHSCATHMLRRGAGLRQIQKLLGHSQLSSTEHYTRVEVSDLRKLLARCHPREKS
jgi:integrase/recombinase XerD